MVTRQAIRFPYQRITIHEEKRPEEEMNDEIKMELKREIPLPSITS